MPVFNKYHEKIDENKEGAADFNNFHLQSYELLSCTHNNAMFGVIFTSSLMFHETDATFLVP